MDSERTDGPSPRQLQAMFRSAPIGMDVLSLDGRWLAVNDAMLELVGLDRAELLRERVPDRTHPDDADEEMRLYGELRAGARSSYRQEKRLRVGAGEDYRWVHVSVVMVRDDSGRPDSVLCMIEDIHDRRAAEDLLRQQALYDPLTGLGNRLLLRKEAERLAGSEGALGLVLVDVDGFKAVNDTHGHAAGDATLRVAAGALQAAAGYDGVPVRLGGDEFVLLFATAADEASSARRAREMAGRVEEALRLRATPWGTVTASTGTATSHASGLDLGSLLRDADAAMYQAKRSRGGSARDRSPVGLSPEERRAGT